MSIIRFDFEDYFYNKYAISLTIQLFNSSRLCVVLVFITGGPLLLVLSWVISKKTTEDD